VLRHLTQLLTQRGGRSTTRVVCRGERQRCGGRRGDSHGVSGLVLLPLALMNPLMHLLCCMGGEEVSLGTGMVEDFENIVEHDHLDLGKRTVVGGGDKLQSAPQEVGMPVFHELDPGDVAALSPLGRGDERDELVPIKEPVGMEKLENGVNSRSRRGGRLSRGRHAGMDKNPIPRGGG
jgi:hypothetical protein